MWALAKTIFKETSPPQSRISLMNLILLHKPQLDKDSEEMRFIKDVLHELISSPITRTEGYLLLDAITKSNPTVYIHDWAPVLISSLKSPVSSVPKELTLGILKHFVKTFAENTSVQEVFQRFIPEIISLLLKSSNRNEEVTQSCKALAVCMQYLPAVVAPFYDEIESFLMEHAGSLDFKTEEGVADCFAAIPICLENRLKPKRSYSDVWLDVFLKILNTLHSLLNEFLKNYTVEGSSVNLEGESLLQIPSDDEESDEYSRVLKRIKIFSSLCRSLSKMMSVHTSSTATNLIVKVPVQDVLRCMERIFHVYDYMKGNRSVENSILNFTYPLMQTSALAVLESLIINLTIIEQSGNVVAILNKIIGTTVSENTEYSAWDVRSSTWKVANAWLKHYGTKSSYDIVNNKFLISELLKDIIPDQGSEVSQTVRKDNFVCVGMREECCIEALKVLSSMFVFGEAFMDKDFINDISSTVLKVSCKVQQSSHPSKKFVYPYTNDDCRWNLYRCLSLASQSDPMQTKYVKQAVNIFRFATKDPHLEVRTVCSTALHSIKFYINPKKPLPEVHAMATRVPPEEEEGGWEAGFNWNASQEEEEERSMDVSPPPCRVEAAYSSDVHPAPSPHYADAVGGTQCNGSAPKQPSHSVSSDLNTTTHSNSESSEVREYTIEEEEAAEDPPPTEALKPRPLLVALKPAQVPDSNNQRGDVRDFAEEEEVEHMAENGVYAESEDEENSDEEDDEGSDEEEENNEGYAPQYGRYSPVSEENGAASPEKKRPRMEEHSSGEEEPSSSSKLIDRELPGEREEIHPPEVHMMASLSSPTVDEMCQDFVLAEPEEIR